MLGNILSDLLDSGKQTIQDLIPDNTEEVERFRYSDMISFYRWGHSKIPGVSGCCVSIDKESILKGAIRPNDRWVIRIVFCDSAQKLLKDPKTGDFFGKEVFANSVDEQFAQFMNGETKKYFSPNSYELKPSNNQSVFKKIAVWIASKLDNTPREPITVAFLKSFRSKQGSKIVVARIPILVEACSNEYSDTDSLSAFTKQDIVVAEYDAHSDTIVKVVISKTDAAVSNLLDKNNGLVIIEDK